jgi:hypothetical protein
MPLRTMRRSVEDEGRMTRRRDGSSGTAAKEFLGKDA